MGGWKGIQSCSCLVFGLGFGSQFFRISFSSLNSKIFPITVPLLPVVPSSLFFLFRGISFSSKNKQTNCFFLEEYNLFFPSRDTGGGRNPIQPTAFWSAKDTLPLTGSRDPKPRPPIHSASPLPFSPPARSLGGHRDCRMYAKAAVQVPTAAVSQPFVCFITFPPTGFTKNRPPSPRPAARNDGGDV